MAAASGRDGRVVGTAGGEGAAGLVGVGGSEK